MVKVVLQYLIPWSTLSALLLLLLHLRMLSEVSETKGMTSSTGLYTEDIESRSSEENKKFNRGPALEANDNQCSGKNKESLSKRELKLRGLCTTSINDNQQRWTKPTSIKTTVHPTKQPIALDMCLIFVYHIATKKASMETTFFATTALLWKLTYAFPLHDSSSTKEKEKTDIPKITPSENKERKARSAAPKNQTQFSQGDCQSEWLQNEQKCYRYFPGKMNYDSASEHCSSFQSKLVTLRTEEDNTFVNQLSDGYLWTGVENSCRNCTDTARRYENWFPGQPDNRSRCVVMVETGEWKDFDCGYLFAFVCEKGKSKAAYSREQLLIALLIPIFSCIFFAVAFTASLLVSSIRRGNQPFKVASRYARAGKGRKIATWDMIETMRTASLRRKETKQRGSIPNIEITSLDQVRDSGVDGRQGGNSEQPNGRTETKEQKGRRKTLTGETSKETSSIKKETSSIKKSTKGKSSKGKSLKGKSSKGKRSSLERTFLQAPTDRRSSGSGSNSSLYELLVRLNKIEFAQGKDNQNSEEHELKRKHTSEGIGEASGGDDLEKLVEKTEQNVRDNCGRKQSFRNMAFRDSLASVETNGGGGVTSVNPSGNIPEILAKDSSEKDSPGKDTSGKVTPGKDTSENVTSEKDPSGNDPRRNDTVEKNNPEDSSVKDTSGKVTPGKDTSENVTSEKDPSGNDPRRNDTVEKDSPGKNNPEKHTPGKHTPDRKYPTDSESDARVSGRMNNTKVLRGVWMEMSEIKKIVRVDVHRTSTPEDSPAIGDGVSVITTTSDSGNYTPGKNVREVSQDGESKCVELQSRVPNTKVWQNDKQELSEKNETVKVDVRRISNDDDFPSCNGSIVKLDSEQTRYEWQILRTYSV